MYRKWAGVFALMMMIFSACCGAAEKDELHAYEYDSTYYKCIGFDSQMPEDVEPAFESVLRAGDEVICGARKRKCYVRGGQEDWDDSILMAVRREGKVLLVHASGVNGDYSVTVETDSFLTSDVDFEITTQPDDAGTRLSHQIIVGDETYTVSRRSYEGNRLWITKYERRMADGSEYVITPSDGSVSWHEKQEDVSHSHSDRRGVFPVRLAAWTHDSFPKSQEEIHAYMDAHEPALSDDEAYIISVNLRERATGNSASWGKYTAKVCVLDQKPGKLEPWFQVDVGGLKGWVSGGYLMKAGDRWMDRLYDAAGHVSDAACVHHETTLYAAPQGESMQRLAAGTLVHVLGGRNGYLHVIVPRGELTWQTDWDGTYGFVKAEDMVVGISKADAIWRNAE
ncbi:MAG: SH3 domain-containing protein [Clostridiales bacterium]|nr:SH3 domain-containing protein [Clostridiales bacterium]